MNLRAYFLLVTISVGVMAPQTPAQQPPSYAKDIKPFIARYCLECHTGEEPNGGLNLESFKTLMEGGGRGKAIVPGQPDKSPLVLQVEGKAKPFMPPKKAKQPKREEIALVRAWVAAGAKDDSATIATTLPEIKPRGKVAAPISALAYRPDGKLLAAGGHGDVTLVDPASGEVLGKLGGQTTKVTALAFSRDGLRLAVASGSVGVSGEIRLYTIPTSGVPAKPDLVIAAHKDLIYDVAFSPDGKVLASTGYDRLIKLWDVATAKEVRTLKDHSDTVYGLSFSPDGKLLASAAADRAVKVWDVATGRRLYTLGDNTDWVYAVAWSPDGRHLAAGGIDKSIRIWEATAQSGKLVHSVFAHEAAITRLYFSADGKTLYSAGEQGIIKAWDAAKMTERTVYPRQPEAILSLAVRPDQIAVGRFDGALVLLDEKSGKVQKQPLPAKPKPPEVTRLTPSAGQRGKTVRVIVEGKYLDSDPPHPGPPSPGGRGKEGAQTIEVHVNHPGISAKVAAEKQPAGKLAIDLTIAPTVPAGTYQLTIKTSAGQSAPQPFAVDLFAVTAKTGGNDSPRTGQKIALSATVAGHFDRAGAVDFYRFDASQGQQVGVQVIASKFDPVLILTDAAGTPLAESDRGVLGFTCPRAGTYAIGVRDREYRGEPSMTYRLQIGDIPIVTAVFPLGLQRGTEGDIHVDGVNLASVRTVRVKAGDAAIGTKLPVKIETPAGPALGNPTVVVGEFAETVAGAGNALAVPGTGNGRIEHPGKAETWRFAAKKGQRLIVETQARRLGSSLDSGIEILDARGQPVPRATLRCVAKTYVTFRDHDSAGSGIRMETWNEFAINDYVLIGDELARIFALPKNPDDDCQFWSVGGRRVGQLDTTPTHHPMGAPMYKVTIHPPGTVFPPNGFPVVTLYYRNDDGGPGYGKDSRIFFDPPADGEYQVRVGDARGLGGREFGYRVTVRPPRPSYQVHFNPTSPAVWKGNAVPITVTAERIDGFDGPIDVRLENVPAGLSAPATTIPAGEESTAFALYAEPSVRLPDKPVPLQLSARAVIDGKEVQRQVAGGVPKVIEPGDLMTTTGQSEVTIVPGHETRLLVKIERRNQHKGRVPLDVRGLPHGVRVLDIGLNGILITEGESSRVVVIYAEPWVKPMTHPFVVLSRSERKGTEHAAKSVLLKIKN
jgi:WD40 repeat protein